MQNAPFGPTSLGNDFKLNNTILIGIGRETDFSVSPFLAQFSDLSNVSFEAVIIENINLLNELPVGDDSDSASSNKESLSRVDHYVKEFKAHDLNISVCPPNVNDPGYLRDRSILYDLFCVGEEVLKEENSLLFDYFYELKCPVLIVPNGENSPDHILFLFDGTPESVLGVKKFIKMFSGKIINSTVTAMILNDHVASGFNEKIIVDFLLANFIDVGVVFTTSHGLDRDLRRIVKQYPKSILLSGLTGAKSIVSQNVCNLISTDNIPVFFSS